MPTTPAARRPWPPCSPHYYGRPTTEKDILDLLTARAKDKAAASFEDMAAILPALGFRGVGLALSPEQLARLKMPVIVFVRARKEDHFAVLAGVGPERVKLADPALGNRSLSWRQFLERWDTRADAQLKGRALAVLPLNTGANTGAPASDFFTPCRRQSVAGGAADDAALVSAEVCGNVSRPLSHPRAA
jgi:predicted double-glycine peptidase